MAYLLDTDVFIRAKNLHYGLDFCPAFWDWLSARNEEGRLFSIEKVSDEIQAGQDELATWAEESGPRFFLKPDSTVFPSFTAVSDWAQNQACSRSAVDTFLQVADDYLVAQAHAGSHTVVTHERPSDSTRKIKIPNACIGLDVKVMTPFEMLRVERARFVLRT